MLGWNSTVSTSFKWPPYPAKILRGELFFIIHNFAVLSADADAK
jgi:hypothetical protein